MRRLAPSLLCFLLAGPGVALAQPAATQPASSQPKTYTVVPGDTCFLVARKVWGDPRQVKLLHKYNPLGQSPHHLKPGQVLIIAPATEPSRLAELSLVVNHVLEFTPDEHAGRLRDPLRGGDRVATGARSIAELTFADLAKLRLGGDSLMVVSTDVEQHAERPGTPHLLRGALSAFVDQALDARGGKLVATNGAEVRLGGGEARVRTNTRDATALSVYRGTSKIRAAKKEVAVAEGYGTRAEKDKAPEPPRPLPSAPTWSAGKAVAVWLHDRTPTSAKLEVVIADHERTKRLHIEVAGDVRFEALRDEQTVDADQPIDVAVPGEGEEFVRVSAIDAADLESAPSAPLRVYATTAPTATLDPSGAAHLPIPTGAVCQLDGREVQGDVVLSREAHVLTCADEQTHAAFEPIRIPARPAPPPPVVAEPAPSWIAPPPRDYHLLVYLGGGVAIDPTSGRADGYVRGTVEGLFHLGTNGRAGDLGVGGRTTIDVGNAEIAPPRAGVAFMPEITYYIPTRLFSVLPFVSLGLGPALRNDGDAHVFRSTVDVLAGVDVMASQHGWVRLELGYQRLSSAVPLTPTSSILLGVGGGFR